MASDVTMFLLEHVCLADRACRAHQLVSEHRALLAPPPPRSPKCDPFGFGAPPAAAGQPPRKCDLGQGGTSLWIDSGGNAPVDEWRGAQFGTSGGEFGQRSTSRHVAAIASGSP